MISFLLFSFTFFAATVHAAIDCPAGPFNPPADATQWTWYPSNFAGSLPPLFPNNFNCNYKINVPQGWSANLRLTVNMTIPSDFAVSVRVTDQNQFSESVFAASSENFFFVSGGGSIQLNTREQSIYFGFTIKWTQNPTNFNPAVGNVTTSAPQPIVWWAFSNNPYRIKADTRVSLIVTPPNEDELFQNLRSLMVYDGPDWNSPCLGNALQLIHSQRQLVSSGQYMTFSQLWPYGLTGRTMVLFQDYQNSKDIVQYVGLAFATLANGGSVNMDGTQGLSAITTVTDSTTTGAEYLTNISGSGKLDVYIGGKTPSKSNLITSYKLDEASSHVPQEFLGYVRTYVLSGTNANLGFNRTSALFSTTAPVGRKGFFASRYYKSGTASPYQDVYDYIRAPTNKLLTYSFNIREADFVGNTTLSIQVYKGAKSTYSQTFTSSNKPTLNTAVNVLGDDFSVTYETYKYSTTGFYLDFELLNSTHNNYKLFAIVSFCLLIFVR